MSDEISVRVDNGIGRITLNRPQALHSLTGPMCESLKSAVDRWSVDSDLHLVMVDHAEGTRGFCAGGNIRMFIEIGEVGPNELKEFRHFFSIEYSMNVAISQFPKPYLSILDGVVMGGGVGISIYGSHRVATEKTIFAMPETAIGLFPDIGAGYFLPRLPGQLGTWLGLTGARLKGSDVAAIGLATHYVRSTEITKLKSQLAQTDFSDDASGALNQVLSEYSAPVPEAGYLQHADCINRCFVHDTAEEIVAALQEEESDWAAEQWKALRSMCPTSVKITLRQLREGAKSQSLEENMPMEYRIVWRRVESQDLIEGVRAVFETKNRKPRWSPATIEEVTDEMVDSYFQPLGENELKV